MEIGIYTFGDVPPSPDGRATVEGQRLRDLIEEVEFADQVGLDVRCVSSRASRRSTCSPTAGPMALAIIGGTPERFAPVVELYRDTARQAGA
jgi:hypothetical protein